MVYGSREGITNKQCKGTVNKYSCLVKSKPAEVEVVGGIEYN